MSTPALRRTEDVEVANRIAVGAIVPAADTDSSGAETDMIAARRYRHAALGDRPVVRLTPQSLGKAEDLTLEYLGFDTPERTTEVGVGRRRALGFPAWALINDPANAHHALNLVKDVERLARQAKSKPGAAKDGFLALGDMLGRSAPHFLPTFYEQAGRIYLEHGNTSYAASMFGKAREAEQVHGLVIDEQRQREVFLEFAFAGALTAKSLSSHAKTLAARHSPDAAHELFTTLCVERTKGGLPPYAGMPEDLRRLARAAKRDLACADEALLREVLGTPALSRAALGFWKSYRSALVALASREPAVRGQLLGFVPDATNCHELWLAILAESGATAALTEAEGTVPPEAEAPSGPAGWLSQFAARRSAGWQVPERCSVLLDLVAAMADRLRADGTPVDLFDWRHTEIDLLDLCVAQRIPLVDPPDDHQLRVDFWLRDKAPGRRDLTALAADDRFLPALTNGLVQNLTVGQHGRLVSTEGLGPTLASPGLRVTLRHWLDEQATAITTEGLAEIDKRLRSLTVVRRPEAFAINPDAATRIASTDMAAVLTRTLRGGLFDELGWPALEEAVGQLLDHTSLEPGSEQVVSIAGEGWPALVVRRGKSLLVVGPDGILLEHMLRIPAELRGRYHDPEASYVDGRLLVRWGTDDGEQAYWSDRPEAIFSPGRSTESWRYSERRASIALPDGGRFTGGRAVHPGDTAIPDRSAAHTDGTTYWTVRHSDGRSRWYEVDPSTGAVGRASLPAFVEDFASESATLELDSCELRPAAPGTESSPLGCAEGMVGWRVRRQADGSWLGEGIDGRAVRVPPNHQHPLAALRMPGDERPRAVVSTMFSPYALLEPDGCALLDPDGHQVAAIERGKYRPEMARGTVFLPPLSWWHCLRVRDEAGSRALRDVSHDTANRLLVMAFAEYLAEPSGGNRPADLANAVHELFPDAITYAEPEYRAEPGMLPTAAAEIERTLPDLFGGNRPADLADAVHRLLPEVTHPELVEGLLGVIRYAARLCYELALYEEIAGQAADSRHPTEVSATPVISDTTMKAALNWVNSYVEHPKDDETTLLPLIDALGELANTNSAREQPIPLSGSTGPYWTHYLPALGALAWRAASPLTPPDHRAALVALLHRLGANGFADSSGHWRIVNVKKRTSVKPNHSIPAEHGFVVLLKSVWHDEKPERIGLQYTAEPGSFSLPNGWILNEATPCGSTFDARRIERFCRALEENGPMPWRSEAAAELAARTGMGRGEATLLLAGLPNIKSWGAHFLTPQERALLGLTSTEAKSARGRFTDLSAEVRSTLLHSAIPEDPEKLWTDAPNLDGLAAEWIKHFGRRDPVPDELLVQARKVLPVTNPAESVTGVANPDSCAWLNTDARMSLQDDELKVGDHTGFQGEHLMAVGAVLPWLAYWLPAGSPIRSRLPQALAAVRARLMQQDFVVYVGRSYQPEPLFQLLGLPAEEIGKQVTIDGMLELLPRQWGHYDAYVRPSQLSAAHEPVLTAVHGALEYAHRDAVATLGVLRDDALTAACALRPAEGTDPGAYYQDPTVSVPELVDRVAKVHGLDTDVATLYLQLLALPDPTDANVARWTGWKPGRLRNARAGLAATDLVLSAKRARAGRSLFLPGGWLALKSPHLPIEAWKAPLFGLPADGPPDGVITPRGTVAELFRTAWQRVEQGDPPAYEELRMGGRR